MATSCGEGWACEDCLMLMAGGEQADMTDEDYDTWQAGIARTLEPGQWAEPGGTHEPYCEDADDCSCMTDTFSWSSCDLCRSGLGGARYRFTFMQSS